MPGGGLRGQHARRFANAKSNMALTLKEADSVAPYIPPTSVPREGKRMRGMRRTNQWYHPSKLINCGKLDSVQTETKLRNGLGYRCNLCGFGAFSSTSSVQKHQTSQACTPSLRGMERERAKKQYRTMFAPVQVGTKTSATLPVNGSSMPTSNHRSSICLHPGCLIASGKFSGNCSRSKPPVATKQRSGT